MRAFGTRAGLKFWMWPAWQHPSAAQPAKVQFQAGSLPFYNFKSPKSRRSEISPAHCFFIYNGHFENFKLGPEIFWNRFWNDLKFLQCIVFSYTTGILKISNSRYVWYFCIFEWHIFQCHFFEKCFFNNFLMKSNDNYVCQQRKWITQRCTATSLIPMGR